MRTATSQFGWWDTPESAAKYLEDCAAMDNRTDMNYGDRVAAQRRARSLPGHEYPTPPSIEELTQKIARWGRRGR